MRYPSSGRTSCLRIQCNQIIKCPPRIVAVDREEVQLRSAASCSTVFCRCRPLLYEANHVEAGHVLCGWLKASPRIQPPAAAAGAADQEEPHSIHCPPPLSPPFPSATPRTVGVTNFFEKSVLKGRAAGSPPQPFGAFVVLPNDKI
jgi:hypothetical protein